MKLSIAEVKRRLAPGVEFTGEFVGTNAARCKPGMQVTRRKVVSNKSQLVSQFIDGPKAGETIYLNWTGVTADERDGSIYLTMTEVSPPEEFLKITL
jgi:hypothetical protein